jgi:CRISPR/Cas system-associated exonuclease Cas4 (RecB family)
MSRLAEHSIVDTVLLENIDNNASLFVFPTDVAAGRWADRLLRLRRQQLADNGKVAAGGTVAMEKFIAWDTFKQNSIQSRVKNRRSVPSALRKMYIGALIRENAELCAKGEQPIFSSLIRAEWAEQADSFDSWLTGILPQLGAWFKQTVGLPIARIGEVAQRADRLTGDDVSSKDDGDLFTLALSYAQFLDQNGLFEPAWETPPFEDTGKECFIFFPESLSDYGEYRELLAVSGHVKTINIDDKTAMLNPSHHFFYTNSRSEITEAALYILALRRDHNVSWDSISVSIPDDECYGPYLFREFENRNIPYVKQSGKPLASYPAGRFFTALADCAKADFSFASVKELLLNRHLPWKDIDTIQDLIGFGIKNNCINSWVEEIDGKEIHVNVWEDAFTHPFGGINPQTRQFFQDLKRRVSALCRAGSFSDIRKYYFAFREMFFNMENCLDETDLILSRCVSELSYLIDLEKSFPAVQVPDHYTFFTGYLQESNYLPQQSSSGVSILPYRTAAPAPFECHIVLGASQSSLSAVFSPLTFLPRSRREKLGITDNDASLVFINLHRFNSRLSAAFFCSEQTFSGYTIPHSSFNAPSKPRQRYGSPFSKGEHPPEDSDPQSGVQFAADLYLAENNFYASLHGSSSDKIEVPPEIHLNQKNGFDAWRLRRDYPPAQTDNGIILTPRNLLLSKIHDRFCHSDEHKNKFSVSSSSLEPYFQCPLIWIFSRIYKLENVEIETGLMPSAIAGEVYHAVLNLYLGDLLKTNTVIGGAVNTKLLDDKIETVFETFPRLPHDTRQVMSMLSARLLAAEKSLFRTRLENILIEFYSYFAGFKIIATEESYTLPQDIYFLNGRVDCILENDDSLAIVDFKTRYKKNEGSFNFQLPLYLRLAEEAYAKEVHAALFFSITDAKHSALFETLQEKKEIMMEFDKKVQQFAQEISSGTFSFIPSHCEHCHDCEYNKVCRTLYKIQQEKNNGD